MYDEKSIHILKLNTAQRVWHNLLRKKNKLFFGGRNDLLSQRKANPTEVLLWDTRVC